MLVRYGERQPHARALGWHTDFVSREKTQGIFPRRELYSPELSSRGDLMNLLLSGKNIVQYLGEAY